jgi:hypothetical protein
MPLTCNIDARGKRLRLIMGIALLALAIILALTWGWRGSGALRWMITAAVFVSGLFVVFEARAGWCAIRAMGFKTKF